MEQLRRSTRRSLLDRTGRAFTLRGDRVVLSPNGPASQSLGLLSECGEATCACCRAVDHRARPFFRRGVVNWAVALGFAPSVRYVSVGAGLLLTDAEIISGLIEGGATIESIQVRALRAMRKTSRKLSKNGSVPPSRRSQTIFIPVPHATTGNQIGIPAYYPSRRLLPSE